MLPKKILNIANELNNSDWIKKLSSLSHIYMVGGCVRDAFLDLPIKDVDLVVENLSLSNIQDLLSSFGRVDIVGKSFSVIKFTPNLHDGEPFDIAIPRIDKKIGDGHKGFEVITDGVNLLKDLERRDFTINSIAFDINELKLIDPFNGINDLNNCIIKATNKKAFTEDPLRIIRGIQFASRFKFNICDETFLLMKENSKLVSEISGERIFEEFQKIIHKKGDVNIAFDLIKDINLDQVFFNNKMTTKTFTHDLDEISFFLMLGKLGKVNPSKFAKTRLKCDANLEKNIQVLDNLVSKLPYANDTDRRMIVFDAFNKAPEVFESSLLPLSACLIFLEMESGIIPKSIKDINLNGDEIMELFNIKGPKIGKLLRELLNAALLHQVDWTNKDECIKFISNKVVLI